MKKLALAAISLLIAGSASAADLRRPAPVPYKGPAPIAVGYNWTGCYIGAGGGYGMWNQDIQLLAGGVPFGFEATSGGRGWFGTVQVGCDYQIGSNIVIGAFGDYDFSGIKGDMNIPVAAQRGDEKLKSSWAAGGRIGWVPFQAQQLLVYVSGGYTQARFGQVDFLTPLGVPAGVSLVKHTYDGWFIGSGYEYAIGFLPSLFWKTEYRFADYGKESVPIVFTATGAPFQSIDSHKYVHTIRSELVWRFNFGGPVVARY